MQGTLVLTYYKLPDMQDEIIGGKIWGKTPYYEAFGYSINLAFRCVH